jgi:outer membrane protein assembly factor BamB
MDALKAGDGSLLWHLQLITTSSNPSSPTLVNGMLYLGAGGPPPQSPDCVCVYALQASDGSVVWKHPTGDQVFAAPTVRDGVVYASEFTDGLFALRASDGRLLWSQPGMEGAGSSTIVDGVIYINGYDQQTYALHASDGSQIWHSQVGNGNGAPVVSDGVVYVGTTVVAALRASDGTFLWRSQESDHLLFSTPYILQGVVFATGVCTDEFNFSGCKDRVVALKGSDGSLFWSKTLARPSAPVPGP